MLRVDETKSDSLVCQVGVLKSSLGLALSYARFRGRGLVFGMSVAHALDLRLPADWR